jgi:phage terminase Nu1 subunit (DNA packaging protein)
MTVVAERPPRNIARLAMEIGVSRQTLYTWGNEGCPLDDGVDAIREWRTEHHPPPRAIADQAKLARARLADAQAYAQEQKNLERDGQLLDAEDANLAVSELCNLIRARLEAIPNDLQTEWPPEVRQQVTERLSDKIHLILTEMSQWRLGK